LRSVHRSVDFGRRVPRFLEHRSYALACFAALPGGTSHRFAGGVQAFSGLRLAELAATAATIFGAAAGRATSIPTTNKGRFAAFGATGVDADAVLTALVRGARDAGAGRKAKVRAEVARGTAGFRTLAGIRRTGVVDAVTAVTRLSAETAEVVAVGFRYTRDVAREAEAVCPDRTGRARAAAARALSEALALGHQKSALRRLERCAQRSTIRRRDHGAAAIGAAIHHAVAVGPAVIERKWLTLAAVAVRVLRAFCRTLITELRGDAASISGTHLGRVVGLAVAVVVDAVTDLRLWRNAADTRALAVDTVPAADPAGLRLVAARRDESSRRVRGILHTAQALRPNGGFVVDDAVAIVVEPVALLGNRPHAAGANHGRSEKLALPVAVATLADATRFPRELRHGRRATR